MIKLSKIDDNLSIYKDNIVVLFDIGSGFELLFNIMIKNNVKIDFICINNKQKKNQFMVFK